METSFRLAEPSDADVLVEMMRGLYEHDRSPFDEPAHRAALALLFESEEHALAYLLLSGAEVAGYVVITFGFSLEFRGRDAFIDELFVKDDFRGRGLGGAAILFAEGVCRGRGVRALHLEVDRENARAQSVYRRSGFLAHKNFLMTKWLS